MKCFIIFLVVVLMSYVAFGQGWEQQNSPTTDQLLAVVFVDSSNGWAVGGWWNPTQSTIVRTTNGGTTWALQTSGTTLQLNGLDFVDVNNGWAVGGSDYPTDSTVILHTTDGGTTWTAQTSDTTYPLYEVSFVDANHGWAVGGIGDVEHGYGCIVHTTDGGGTWTYQYSDSTYPLYAVDFVDANTGWAAGGWVDQSPGPLDDAELILHTTNGGATWTTQTTETTYPMNDVFFLDANNGWAVGGFEGFEHAYGCIVHTTDGGNTWMTQINDGGSWPRPIYSCVAFADANNGWALSQHLWYNGSEWTGILHTTDGGETWAQQNVGLLGNYGFSGVTFADANNGWAVGTRTISQDSTCSIILHTANGGEVWAAPHENTVPMRYGLLQNYPNPFNPSTTLAYDLPKPGHISLRVFDLLGREVEVLKDDMMEAGSHRVMFDGSNLASGIYFARLEAGKFSQTKQLMLMK
jgi:photosystem II stability/assembly factor-like uncharacterized protein